MKKLLLLSILLVAACDDNSNKQSSNPNTTSGLLSALTQRDVEFFKNNPQEREVVLKRCGEALRDKKISDPAEFPGCDQAFRANIEVKITTELKGDISAEGFRKNRAQHISTDLEAADDCRANDPTIPLDHPICKAIIEYARQLKAECKNEICADSNELFRRLHIKE